MARFLTRATALSSLLLFVGCGGGTPPAQAPVDTSQGSAKTAKTDAAPPDLSPVAAPKDLFLVGRFKDPGAAADTISNWAGMPVDWRKLVARRQPGLSRIVAVDAPVDVAAALDPTGVGQLPQPFVVITVGLNSLDEAIAFARKQGEDVHEMSRGVYRVGDGGDFSCAVAASVGKVPARLVCGDRRQDVDALLPYATRGLPNADLGQNDLHIELRAEPFRRHYARQLREMKTLAVPFVLKELSLDSPSFDRALADGVHGLGDEFLALVEDLDTIDIEGRLDKQKQQLVATGTVKFRGDSSWTVHTMQDSAKRAGPPPDMFWKLPKDVASAGYGVSPNPKRYQDIARTAEELADGLMSHEQVPRRVRDEAVDAIEQLFKLDGAHVFARGAVPVAGQNGLEDLRRNRVISTVGWNVIGFDTKPAQLKKLLSTLVKVYNDRQLKKLLDKELGKDKKNLPTLKVHAARARGIAPGSTAYDLVLPGSLFERHSSYFGAQKKKAAKKKTPKSLTVTIVLMPEGNQTWLGVSADSKALYEKLAQIHTGKDTLASREGLAQLKSSKAISGGFMTLAGFTNGMRSDMRAALGPGFAKALEKVFNALPNHGETPIPYTLMVGQSGGVSLDWSLRAPKAVVVDIGALVPAVIALKSQMGGGAMMHMP
jgi:hypothetical protein